MAQLRIDRVLALMFSAYWCALLAGFAALWTTHRYLPPTDGAHGTPFLRFLADPLVWIVFVPTVLLGGTIGFVLSLFLLRRTRLSRAIPIVFGATVVASALAGIMGWLMSPLFGMLAGLIAMVLCAGHDERAVEGRAAAP